MDSTHDDEILSSDLLLQRRGVAVGYCQIQRRPAVNFAAPRRPRNSTYATDAVTLVGASASNRLIARRKTSSVIGLCNSCRALSSAKLRASGEISPVVTNTGKS